VLPLPYVLSGIGSGGVGGMVDPDGRLAQRLRHNIANNPHYCEGTGTPITVMGALRDLQKNSTSEFFPIGKIGQNLAFRMLRFWLINNPRANLGFAPDQLMYQIQDPRSRELETRLIEKESDFKRCMREVVQRAPNQPTLRLVVVKPVGGGGQYGNMTLNMWEKACQMLQQDPSIPTAAKRGNKIKRIARELIAFCRQNGVLKLALTRQQCSQFFISRDIPNAKHVVAAIDKNNDGVCDFREIVIGAVTAGDAKAGPMHSAKLLFDSYDNDKSGSIDSQEVHLLMFSFLLFFFSSFLSLFSSSIFWFIIVYLTIFFVLFFSLLFHDDYTCRCIC